MTESAIAVVRVDVAGVDLPTVRKLVSTALLESPAMADEEGLRRQFAAGIQMASAVAERWQAAFVDAGGREIYAVVDLAGVPDAYLILIVPLREGAEADVLTNLLRHGRPQSGPGNPPRLLAAKRRTPTALVLGGSRILNNLAEIPKADPQPFVGALGATGDAPVRLAVALNRPQRRVLRELLPDLPREMGEQGLSPLIDHGRFLAAGLETPPDAGLTILLRTDEAEAARLCRKLYDALAALVLRQARREGGPLAEVIELLAPALRPDRDGTDLRIRLDQEEMVSLARDAVTPLVLKAREAAGATASAARLQGVLNALIRSATDFPGAFPPDLQTLVEKRVLTEQMLALPHRPERSYVYRKPPVAMQELKTAARVILLHEPADPWPASGVNVGFADGHIERVASQEQFEQRLAASKAAVGGPER